MSAVANIAYYAWAIRPGVSPQILSACFHPRAGGWKSRRIKHAAWVLDTLNRGEGHFRVGSPRAPWRKRFGGTAHLYAPGVAYWEQVPDARKPPDACYLTFSGGAAVGLSTMATGPGGFAAILDPEGQIFERIQHLARTGQHKGEHGFFEAQAELFQILDVLRGAQQTRSGEFLVRTAGKTPPDPSLSERATIFMKENLSRRITLAQMAGHLHVSASSLSHRFRRETGETPQQALIQLRIQAACDLILHGWKLHYVAQQTGFHDAFHLSRTFRKITGMSPRQFVANHQRG